MGNVTKLFGETVQLLSDELVLRFTY